MAKKPLVASLDADTTNNIASTIVEAIGAAQSTADALVAAKGAAADASNNSIRTLATKLHGINYKLNAGDIEAIATTAATVIGKGNPSVVKSRKSEIKLMLTLRDELPEVVSKLDDLLDEGHTFNLRSKTLAVLRQLRKDTALQVDEVVDVLREELDAPAPTKEDKLVTTIGALSANKAFLDAKGKLLPKAAKAIAELKQLAVAALPAGEAEPEAPAKEPPATVDEPTAATAEAPAAADEVDTELLGFDLEALMKSDT